MLNKNIFLKNYPISHKDLKFKLISFFPSLHMANFVTMQDKKVSILKVSLNLFPSDRLNEVLGTKD